MKNLYIFQSIATNQFNENSDIDCLVSFAEEDLFLYTVAYFFLQYALPILFSERLEIIRAFSLNNPYFTETTNISKYNTANYGLEKKNLPVLKVEVELLHQHNI